MVNLVSINIPPGVVRGATPLDAKGRWWNTNLVRWRNGVLEPVKGWSKIHTTPLEGGRIRKLDVWRDNLNFRHILAATDQKIFVDLTDVTPDGFSPSLPSIGFTGYGVGEYGMEEYGTERSEVSYDMQVSPPYWTFARWGEDMLAVMSVDGNLYHFDATFPAQPFKLVNEAPTNNVAVHVTPERHVLLLQLGGNPRRLGWSSRESLTDWDFMSTTNTAGFLDLETATPLLKAVDSRAGTLVFSHSDVFLLPYVGLPYIYGRQWLGKTRVLNPDTIVHENGNVFWWATDGFKMWDGGQILHLDCPVWDYIMSRSDLRYLRTFAHGGGLGLYPEIWWFYPSAEAGAECDSYVMFNYVEGWWAIGSLSRTAVVAADADRYPYMGGEDGFIYQHENGWYGAMGGNVRPIFAETAALSVGTGSRVADIKQVLLATGHGYDALRLRFYTNLAPEGPGRVFGPYRARPDGYMDVRVTGRDIRFRFEAVKDTDWSLGETRMDISVSGAR